MKLRFSVRDLLWLTALVAVLVAWWIDRNNLIAKYDVWDPNGWMIKPPPKR
jgi:hypothetical protein